MQMKTLQKLPANTTKDAISSTSATQTPRRAGFPAAICPFRVRCPARSPHRPRISQPLSPMGEEHQN